MESYGVVQEVFENKARVRFLRQSACGENCASCSGCSQKELLALAENPLDAKPGDRVRVESDTGKILFSAFLLYIVPLIVLLGAYGLAALFLKKPVAAILAVLFFFSWFIVLKKLGNPGGVQPVITEIIKPGSESN